MLLVEGAPGFRAQFPARAHGPAIAASKSIPSFERGATTVGANTFYVQAARARADALTSGYPTKREALFDYDVVVLANVDVDQLKGVELDLTRAFVGERGGGLLVLGARGFQRQGLRGTPLEDVLPLELADRDRRNRCRSARLPGMNRVALTPSGEDHPVMQLATTPDESMKRWAAVPPLAVDLRARRAAARRRGAGGDGRTRWRAARARRRPALSASADR